MKETKNKDQKEIKEPEQKNFTPEVKAPNLYAIQQEIEMLMFKLKTAEVTIAEIRNQVGIVVQGLLLTDKEKDEEIKKLKSNGKEEKQITPDET